MGFTLNTQRALAFTRSLPLAFPPAMPANAQ
jgi:hypothetical protein